MNTVNRSLEEEMPELRLLHNEQQEADALCRATVWTVRDGLDCQETRRHVLATQVRGALALDILSRADRMQILDAGALRIHLDSIRKNLERTASSPPSSESTVVLARYAQAAATDPDTNFLTKLRYCEHLLAATASTRHYTELAPFTEYMVVRAVLLLSDALEHTASLLRAVRKWQEGRRILSRKGAGIPQAWQSIELERLDESLVNSIWRLGRKTVLGRPGAELLEEPLDPERKYIVPFLCHRTCLETGKSADGFLRTPELQALLATLSMRRRPSFDWLKAAVSFENVGRVLRARLEPLASVVETALEHEIGFSERSPRWPELVFLASAYGALSRDWKDSRVRRATERLIEHLEAEREYVLSPQAEDAQGYTHADFVHASAQLMERFGGSVYGAGRTLMRGCLRHRANGMPIGEWSSQPVARARGTTICWCTTALQARALGRIERLFRMQSRERIFQHFNVSVGSGGGQDLDEVFYPDYGLHHFCKAYKKRGASRSPELKHESIALVLQHINAHLSGRTGSPFSLVLHGPPGTGKTFLCHALAASAGVPVVCVTPSDLLVSGSDRFEQRAQAVFDALAMLTDCVILLDEFDPVIQRRSYEQTQGTDAFAFLTPGMLPKLANLYDGAKKQRTAYVLATNRIGLLDEAAVREGRFDRHVGVFPPDLLSRMGRIAHECAKHSVLGVSEDGKVKLVLRI